MNFFIKNSIDAQWGIETDNNSLKSSPFSIIWERNRKLIPSKNHCNATSLWRVAGKKIKVKTVIIFLCKYFINNMTYFRFFIVWFHILVCWGVFLNDFNACTVTTERVSSFVGEIFMKMFWIMLVRLSLNEVSVGVAVCHTSGWKNKNLKDFL